MIKHIFRELIIQNNTIAFTAVAFMLVVLSTMTINNSYAVNAWQENITKTGTFNYTQTNESGNPAWTNTGNWSLIESKPLVFIFDAVINMVKPDGSEAHKHEVSDLAISYAPINRNNSTIIDGTATITMREGPVTDEPTTITLSGKNISVYFNPTKIDNHFGNQSIIGLVTD